MRPVEGDVPEDQTLNIHAYLISRRVAPASAGWIFESLKYAGKGQLESEERAF